MGEAIIFLIIAVVVMAFYVVSITVAYTKERRKFNKKSDEMSASRRAHAATMKMEREETARRRKELADRKSELENTYTTKLSNLENAYNTKFAELENDFRKLCIKNEETYKHKNKEFEKQREIIDSKTQSYPFAAELYATVINECCLRASNELKDKKKPAFKAADKLCEYAAELKQWVKRAKLAENQLAFYEELFPWLEEFKEIPPNDAWDMVNGTDSLQSEYDHYKNWLSPTEYNALSQSERNQLALDRYKKRHKTNWEIGIEYERFVGYKYEMRGFRVSYIGATKGLEDMGRDLVAKNDTKTYIIQCKRWAQEKTIHEKHIFQLYGTTVLYKMDHPRENIQPLFVTTAQLSDMAKQVADYLKITIVDSYVVDDYPLIKCNIGKDGEKIYHLPFDQQYDTVVITPSQHERYVYTVEEAESLGFRHAFRWHGE